MLSAALPTLAPSRRSPEEARLLAENRRLRNENEALRQALHGVERDGAATICTDHEWTILSVLMSHAAAKRDVLEAAMEAAHPTKGGRQSNNVAVHMMRIRRKLELYGVEIRNRSGIGYWIEPEGKAALRRAFGVEER